MAPVRSKTSLAPEALVVLTIGFVISVGLIKAGSLGLLMAMATLAGLSLLIVSIQMPGEDGSRRGELIARLGFALPLLVMISLMPLVSAGSSRQEALNAAATLGLRSLTGITAATALSFVLRPEEIAIGLSRLHVPPVMITIALLMLRYLSLITQDWRRTRQAMTARGHDPQWFYQARPLASAAGTLFLRTHQRGEQVNQAMLSRGYTGSLPAPEIPTTSFRAWIVVAVALLSSLSVAAYSHGLLG